MTDTLRCLHRRQASSHTSLPHWDCIGRRLAIDQHAHGQQLAWADSQWVDLGYDHHFQLIQAGQLRPGLIDRQAVLQGLGGFDGAGDLAAALVHPFLVRGLRPQAIIKRHGQHGRGLERLQARLVVEALHGHRDHPSTRVIGPGTADLIRLEGFVLGTVAVDHFDMPTALLGPQAMGRYLGGEQQAEHGQ